MSSVPCEAEILLNQGNTLLYTFYSCHAYESEDSIFSLLDYLNTSRFQDTADQIIGGSLAGTIWASKPKYFSLKHLKT